MCMICTGEIYTFDLKIVHKLDVPKCIFLTSAKLHEILSQCTNLTELRCVGCSFLAYLDLSLNIYLKDVCCAWCENIENINVQKLKYLEIFNCRNTSIISLDLRNCIYLKNLYVSNCKLLISLQIVDKILYNCVTTLNSPWISQNRNFSSNLQKLIKLQRWCRKLLIIKYIKSQEFVEWFYNPNNIGGRVHKLRLLKEFS